MCKLDIKNACRYALCVAKTGIYLVSWEVFFYIRLPYGSRSSPHKFNNLADLLCWVFINIRQIPTSEHYLDDYLLVAHNRALCSQYLTKATDICQYEG